MWDNEKGVYFMILSDYLKVWLDTYVIPNRAPKTADAYRYALAHLSPEILTKDIGELSAIELQRECNALSAKYSRQAQILHVALGAAFRRAERLGMVARSPMVNVEKPRHEKREISYFSPAEASAYFQAAQKQRGGKLLILMLCIGLRRNEARGLRCGDLGPDGILHIRSQRIGSQQQPLKTQASRRDIPLPEALRSFFDGPEGEYLADISETALRRAHFAAMKAAGIDADVTLHGLRHTCATMAIVEGAQVATVQRLLGHARFAVTVETYVHIDTGLLAGCTSKIIGAFFDHHMEKGARLEIV